MTDAFQTAFDLQRSAIEQTQELTLATIEAQTTAAHAAADGLETYEQVLRQSADLGEEALHAYLDVVEETVPEADLEEVRDLVDEGFAANEELQDETWTAIHDAVDESVEGVEAAAENYEQVVESAFDSYVSATEQVEASAGEFEEIDVSAD